MRSKRLTGHSAASSALPGLPSPLDFDGRPKLVLIGGCRDAADEARVAKLRELAASLNVENDVEFQINVDSRTLASYLGSALICVHTMWNEHFGISCVEAQASGCVLLAHNSGGPKQDIAVVQDGMCHARACSHGDCFALPVYYVFLCIYANMRFSHGAGHATGFLATTPEEYAASMERIFSSYFPPLPQASDTKSADARAHGFDELHSIRVAAQARARMFSDENFCESFLAAFARAM